MQLSVENPGKALIHFMKARSVMMDRYNSLANCKSCDQQMRDSLKEGAEFFSTLFEQVRNIIEEERNGR
jgi:N-acetylglucosamine-6-phosphate deacetylase